MKLIRIIARSIWFRYQLAYESHHLLPINEGCVCLLPIVSAVLCCWKWLRMTALSIAVAVKPTPCSVRLQLNNHLMVLIELMNALDAVFISPKGLDYCVGMALPAVGGRGGRRCV